LDGAGFELALDASRTQGPDNLFPAVFARPYRL